MKKNAVFPIFCLIVGASCQSSADDGKDDVNDDVINPGTITQPIKWESTGILINPKSDENHDAVSVKDPTIVYYDNKWHIYATIYNKTVETWNMVYISFSDWSQADSATFEYMDSNPDFEGYKCAPQVFYFEPHQKWYLIYQTQPPAYSTADTIGGPGNWSAKTDFYAEKPQGAPNLWIDYWIICDDDNAYMFFSGDDGRLYRSQTTLANFPNGFGDVTTVMLFNNSHDLFEACNIYKVKEHNKYLLLNECIGSSGNRYFKSFISDSLTSTWYELAASESDPFFGSANVTFENGVTPWTTDFSHGELIRDGYDQTLTINDEHLQFLYQGNTYQGSPDTAPPYNEIPWSLGILNQVEVPNAKSILDVDLQSLTPHVDDIPPEDEITGEEGDPNVLVVELEGLADQPLFPPFAVIDDPDASGGKAIVWPDNNDAYDLDTSDDKEGQVAISFALSEQASVLFQILTNMSSATNDSFFYKVDDGEWGTQNNQTTSGYELLSSAIFKDLSAGTHVLKIMRREDGTLLDKVVLKASAGEMSAVDLD